MGGIDKIIKKFNASKFGHTFEECKKVLEYIGFEEKSSKGSHHKFVKAGLNRPFILAKHHPIDPAAINDILDFLNDDNLFELQECKPDSVPDFQESVPVKQNVRNNRHEQAETKAAQQAVPKNIKQGV